jgi:hypothetical protein
MNQAVNLFWTILCFTPVVAVWVSQYSVLWFFFLITSVLSQLFPSALLQLSREPKFYERMGVKFIRKFVQNGQYVSRYLRKGNPGYRVVTNKASALQYQNTVLMYERFHLICFLFFLMTAVYAVIKSQIELAIIVTVANIIYNVYPILLQQYNRARLQRVAEKQAR